MKRLKKILALALAMAMVLGMMSLSAWAADTPTGSITIKKNDTVDVKDKEFKAYKILDATWTSDGENVSYTVPAAMKSFYDDYFKEGAKDASTLASEANRPYNTFIAEKIAALNTSAKLADFIEKALAAAKVAGITGVASDANGKISPLDSGYYIIEDTSKEEPVSSLMLDTVNSDGTGKNVDIVVKANQPTPKKEIETATGTTNHNNTGIGQTVNYKVTEDVPNWTGYEYYYFIMNDDMSDGLTFNKDSVVVSVDLGKTMKTIKNGNEDVQVPEKWMGTYTEYQAHGTYDASTGIYTLTKDAGYYVYTDDKADGHTFQIAFENVMNFAIDADITAKYSAQVNDSAVTGIDPNTNDVNIKYSNTPGKSGRGDKDEQPGKPADTTTHPLGDGPHDATVTYTTEIKVIKVDGKTKEAIPGVEFTLTGTSTTTVLASKYVYNVAANGTYWMLKDGTYTTDEPIVADKMEAAEPGATSGYVAAEAGYEGADAITVGETVYRPYRSETDTDSDIFVLVHANSGDYASTSIKYNQELVNTASEKTVAVKQIGTTDASGNLVFDQLGAGTYTLEETGVPEGYNKADNIIVKIGYTGPTEDVTPANIDAKKVTCTWTKQTGGTNDSGVKEVTKTVDGKQVGTGKFQVTIENNKGTELPSTGGIGTTIFYVVGTILVIGAGVVLITKRRMEA